VKKEANVLTASFPAGNIDYEISVKKMFDCTHKQKRRIGMAIPKLQVALDTTSMCEAFQILGNGLDGTVDIVECGTMLLLHEGLHAVDYLRAIYPDKPLVADFKCVAPHFGSRIIEHNPDYITVLSAAEPHVQEGISREAIERGKGQEVQIEIYGSYTLGDVKRWKEYGIRHVIYNRPRTRKGPWGEEDVADLRALIDLDMQVTATGGISYDTLDVVADLPLFAVICGRSVLKAEHPAEEALRIKGRMAELWS